jgi:hypothetical protein
MENTQVVLNAIPGSSITRAGDLYFCIMTPRGGVSFERVWHGGYWWRATADFLPRGSGRNIWKTPTARRKTLEDIAAIVAKYAKPFTDLEVAHTRAAEETIEAKDRLPRREYKPALGHWVLQEWILALLDETEEGAIGRAQAAEWLAKEAEAAKVDAANSGLEEMWAWYDKRVLAGEVDLAN